MGLDPSAGRGEDALGARRAASFGSSDLGDPAGPASSTQRPRRSDGTHAGRRGSGRERRHRDHAQRAGHSDAARNGDGAPAGQRRNPAHQFPGRPDGQGRRCAGRDRSAHLQGRVRSGRRPARARQGHARQRAGRSEARSGAVCAKGRVRTGARHAGSPGALDRRDREIGSGICGKRRHQSGLYKDQVAGRWPRGPASGRCRQSHSGGADHRRGRGDAIAADLGAVLVAGRQYRSGYGAREFRRGAQRRCLRSGPVRQASPAESSPPSTM